MDEMLTQKVKEDKKGLFGWARKKKFVQRGGREGTLGRTTHCWKEGIGE